MVCIAQVITFATAVAAGAVRTSLTAPSPDKQGPIDFSLQVSKEAIITAMTQHQALVGTVHLANQGPDSYSKAASEDQLLVTFTVGQGTVRPKIQGRVPIEWFDF